MITHIRRTSGFTLIELIIAITMFALLSVTISSIYIQTTYLWQKLKHTRHLSETAREITERIADDVREKGINISESSYDDRVYDSHWRINDYIHSWSEILWVGDSSNITQYVFGTVENWSVRYCKETERQDIRKHCGLYIIKNHDFSNYMNLVDSFIPEEEKKRVKIQNLRFYISGDGKTTEKKVTLVFDLTLMPRIWVPFGMIGETQLHVQTTISERFFKETTP